ncbi:MAG: 30S ribosomal protein S7 [Armatimonadetes bacterium CG_4_10_14_3_um_filter_66_18]|nr:30S ribosomal protein S7 [Armatimonadota bacterium]OIO92184.1 MAG: 30S ribosomal protein S7 [Armatimonadetes bacterium CG2_30_66_41]PIU95829.1 MAG: 30S ribosomal protein S7 [Armatimonadetes bacterium CG06_land_8_20_14_3_00_66_21]PIW15654.1 MAG: 30S ribosomal protein S7 [Armatimonadetes bacterium CG17_big_fil_post_rev_8_21_14_2_50_66_6]PIX43069.1 MAG: 30S ribosomal protein S7 [Armatimonadetes bacterium CG_4_8_14_3_um_filter_66_20]PIY35836.1 MAG: 30S ribosomal protein S7 [Armatimonadetes bact
MARKAPATRRQVLPDPVFESVLVSRMINYMMKDGKKVVAEKQMYGALQLVAERTKRNPLDVLVEAFRNISPQVEVRSRRVGGATYQVPMEVRSERRIALPIRWLIGYARARNEKTMSARLAGEIMDAASSQGAAVKKRDDTHKMAEANKAFAHYRW